MTDHSADGSDARGWLPRPVLVLVGARAVNQLGAFSVPFVTVLLAGARGASVTTAGLVVAMFGAATIPSRLVGGRLTLALGARSTMVLGLVSCAVAQLAIAAAPGLLTTVFAVALLGLAHEVYEPASQSVVADLTPAAYRSRAFGLFGAALALGGLGSGLLAVVLGGLDLRLLFVADALSCLVCALVVRLGLPGGSRVRASVPGGAPAVRPWRDGRLLVMLLVGTGFATLYLQLRIALPLTLVARDVPVQGYGLVVAVSSLTVVLAQPLLGWSRLPSDPFTVMSAGYVVLGCGLVATAYASSLAGLVTATVVWALGDVLLLGHPFAVVADLAPAGASAPYLAVFGLCWGLGGIVAPLVGTGLLAAVGSTGLWLTCAAAAGILAAAQPAVRRLVGPDGPFGVPTDQFTPSRGRGGRGGPRMVR